MKLLKLWNKIGKQPLKISQYIDVIIKSGNDKFYVTGVNYNNGKFESLQAEKICCSTCDNFHKDIPHTCDFCTSLDQEEDYGMWKIKR